MDESLVCSSHHSDPLPLFLSGYQKLYALIKVSNETPTNTRHHLQESDEPPECMACEEAKYKSAQDDSGGCIECPSSHMTSPEGSVSPDQCECIYGFSWELDTGGDDGNASDTNTTSSNSTSLQRMQQSDNSTERDVWQCVRIPGAVTLAEAAQAAAMVSSVVSAVVATNVAVAVGTAVGGAVSGAVGGAVGGGAGGGVISGAATAAAAEIAAGAGAGAGWAGAGGAAEIAAGAGSMALISQVQYLNVAGKVGGSNASKSLATFSGGFGWANMEVPMADQVYPWRSQKPANGSSTKKQRRSSETLMSYKSLKECAVNASYCEEQVCSFDAIAPSVEKLTSSATLMFFTFLGRSLFLMIMLYGLKKDPDSLNAFRFPSWEGPVLSTTPNSRSIQTPYLSLLLVGSETWGVLSI